MNIKIISKSDLTPSIWDGGKTYEYYISPIDSSYVNRDFDFRISSATIEKTPSNFTKFGDYHRYLVMLDNDLIISRNGIDEQYSKNEIFEFDSADSIQSFSLGNDFNLMVKNDENQFHIEVKALNYDYENNLMFAFALGETMLKINQQEFKLIAGDLIIIDNQDNQIVTYLSNREMIVGCNNPSIH